MDSRLLNVLYDDPFDGNYVKFGNDTEYWSGESETIGMQLTETLHGILPIAPTEDFHKNDNSTTLNMQTNKSAFNCKDFPGLHMVTDASIEVVSGDPNDNFDTDSESEKASYDDNDDNDEGVDNNLFDFDRQSQCSNVTFRTRTDSSSIGDYESHTSDYDDDDNDDNDDKNKVVIDNGLTQNSRPNVVTLENNSIINLHPNLIGSDDLLLDTSYHKSRTLSTNTIGSDVDGFGLQIDANNFDLAEFITKDDFVLHAMADNSDLSKQELLPSLGQTSSTVQIISSKHNDGDSDSDIIVDVETVEGDDDGVSSSKNASEFLKPSYALLHPESEEEVANNDNVKYDPPWSPNQKSKNIENYKVEEKVLIQKPNFVRNFSLVPNKKQCDLLKGKFAKGKGKPAHKSTKPLIAKAFKPDSSSLKDTTSIIVKTENSSEKTIRKEGNNLASVKHESVSILEQSSEDNNPPVKGKTNEIPSLNFSLAEKADEETPAQQAQSVKRKLNLEEYKKRRCGEPLLITPVQANIKLEPCKIPKLDNKTQNVQNNNDKKTIAKTVPTKRSEAVTSIVKTLKEQQKLSQKPNIDPITEARNKVLRMQELKKAQQMRIIDTTISAKVPRVTKILPLKEIVKDTPYLNEDEKKSISPQSLKSDYEEIIIVSVSCNTDISIPPRPNEALKAINNASRSLLKSSALLSTISNTFLKVKASDNSKLLSSSLIASIQDVVAKKALPVEETDTSTLNKTEKPEHHGENKIIMHLRKDRIRKRMCTIGIQTDLQPEFPTLSLWKINTHYKSRERTHKHRQRQYRKYKERSPSSTSESSSDDQSYSSNSSAVSRYRDNSSSSSLERVRTYDSAIGTGGYSSRSSLKYRSSISSSYSESADRTGRGRRQRRTSYTKRSSRKRSRSPYTSSSYSSDSDCSRNSMYRRSRSRSNSRTRTRSRRPRYRYNNKNDTFSDRNISQPAVEERRIVYVGRIEPDTTKDMLRRKFLQYGTIKQISLHYKDTGLKYGFVTFERSQDAFAAIDNSSRDPQINMYDVSFGGRRAFCRASYEDLDNAGINTYHSYVFPQPPQQPKEEDSFEALLMEMKAKLNANKTNTTKITNGQNSANKNRI